MSVLLEVKNLKKYFKTPGGMLHAVDDVSFAINEGETLGVVGESGCGKSTLGRTVIHLLPKTDGQIIFAGEDVSDVDNQKLKELRRDMQMIFQDPYASIDPRKSVIEVIAEYMLIHKTHQNRADIYNRAAELMDMVGLARRYANMYPHELDGGRRQRIGIARALSLNPKFIVCDEPVSALDVSIQAQILNLLMDLGDELNLTYLFITHDLSVVKHISDRVAVLYLGTLVELTTSAKLYDNPLHPYTQALLSAIPIPDPEIEKERDENKIRLEGEVPSPINTKPGCRFRGRCKYAMPVCEQEMPPLTEIGEGHYVACHRCVQGNDGK